MPHVSRNKLDKKTRRKIFEKMIISFGHNKNDKERAQFLDELLTETEKIMLAKRLAIILMLAGEIPQNRISEALSVSTSTIRRFALSIENGKHNYIRRMSDKDKIDLEKIVWLLLTAGGIMPPRAGGKYWRKKGLKTILER